MVQGCLLKNLRKEIKNFIINHKISSQGINSGEFIEEIFNKKALEKNIKKISQIKMPIVIPSVDISSSKEYLFTSVKKKQEKYISDIEIGKAVRASSSFPVIYEPVPYKDKMFIDGGILNNIPVNDLKEIGADKVIAVNFDSDKIEDNSNAIDITMKILDVMGNKISDEDLEESDYTITVPTNGTGLLDVEKIDFCYKSGYETTLKQIEKIKDVIKE